MAIFDNKRNDLCKLAGVRVYLSGDFFTGKEKLEKRLEEARASIEKSDLARADIIVLGLNQPMSDVRARIKRQLWDGWDIVTMTEEQLRKVLLPPFRYEEWKYFKEQIDSAISKGRKHIDITYDNLFNPVYSPIVHFPDDKDAPTLDDKDAPTLEDKEVFMFFPKGCDFKANDPVKIFLERQGAIVKDTFDPAKTDYCLLRESTLEQLKEGKKDDFIQAIEDGYNSSSCNEFRPKFILESEVLALMKNCKEL